MAQMLVYVSSEYNDQLPGDRMAFLDFYLCVIIPGPDNGELWMAGGRGSQALAFRSWCKLLWNWDKYRNFY